jgi:hypothetical protein
MNNTWKNQKENYQEEEAAENKANVNEMPPEEVPNPVERMGEEDSETPVDDQTIKDAIDELNPDDDSMDSRG